MTKADASKCKLLHFALLWSSAPEEEIFFQFFARENWKLQLRIGSSADYCRFPISFLVNTACLLSFGSL